MFYPRIAKLNGCETLVESSQMCGYREHMFQHHRILFLSGVIGAKCSVCGQGETDTANLLIALNDLSHEPIIVDITSPGGDLDTTFLIIDVMKMIESPVITMGKYCASAACLILASGDKRYLYTHAKTMLHLARGQLGGDYKDFAIQHKLMVNYQDKIVDILKDAGVKKNREEILEDIDRDFWLEPAEACAYGLADEILTKEKWGEMIK
jgi:ATP-dependent Clp protease, protease subunit